MAHDTIRRQWLILRKIPRRPNAITTSELRDYLVEEGHEIDIRSVQRDLNDLSIDFPITVEDAEAKPQRWYWSNDTKNFDLPDMDLRSAMTFKLVDRFLHGLIPPSVLADLQPHFGRADEVLKGASTKGLARWANKVRVVPYGPGFIAAKGNADVLPVVYEALLKEKQFTAKYRKRGETKDATYRVKPYAMVARDAVLYLVCALNDHENPVHLSVHRIKTAELLDEPVKVPATFDIDKYLAEGNVGFRLSREPMKLKVAFHPGAAATVEETPLSDDQKVTVRADDWHVVTATVADSRAVRGWLFSYGKMVEILQPKSLRTEFAEVAHEMAKRHRDS